MGEVIRGRANNSLANLTSDRKGKLHLILQAKVCKDMEIKEDLSHMEGRVKFLTEIKKQGFWKRELVRFGYKQRDLFMVGQRMAKEIFHPYNRVDLLESLILNQKVTYDTANEVWKQIARKVNESPPEYDLDFRPAFELKTTIYTESGVMTDIESVSSFSGNIVSNDVISIAVADRAFATLRGRNPKIFVSSLRAMMSPFRGCGIDLTYASQTHFIRFPKSHSTQLYLIPFITQPSFRLATQKDQESQIRRGTNPSRYVPDGPGHCIVFVADRRTGLVRIYDPLHLNIHEIEVDEVIDSLKKNNIYTAAGAPGWTFGGYVAGKVQNTNDCIPTCFSFCYRLVMTDEETGLDEWPIRMSSPFDSFASRFRLANAAQTILTPLHNPFSEIGKDDDDVLIIPVVYSEEEKFKYTYSVQDWAAGNPFLAYLIHHTPREIQDISRLFADFEKLKNTVAWDRKMMDYEDARVSFYSQFYGKGKFADTGFPDTGLFVFFHQRHPRLSKRTVFKRWVALSQGEREEYQKTAQDMFDETVVLNGI